MFLEDQIWNLCWQRLRELESIRRQLEDADADKGPLSFLLDDVRRMEEDARLQLRGKRQTIFSESSYP